MKKKVKVVTVIDPSNGKDESVFVQTAVRDNGEIRVLRTGTLPFIPVSTPKPAADFYEKLKDTLEKKELRLGSPDMLDAMAIYMGTKPAWGRTRITKGWYTRRPPSNHRRIYKPGPTIKTMSELVKELDNDNYVFFRHKAYHPGWVRGFQLGYVMWNLRSGNIRKAVKL